MTDSMLRTRLGTLRQSLGGTRPNLDHSAMHLRRPNRRAIKAWPPLQALSPRYAALDLLGHLHHVLLNASPREPPPILEEALSALRVACGREADDELARDVLHLYLAYPSPDHDYQSLIETFLRLRPSVKLSRQTLHLALLSVVLPGRSLVPIHRTSDVLLVSEPQHSTCPSDGDTQTNPPVTKTVDPVTIIQSFSTRYHITPGLETYRHLARWGLFKYRPEVAKLAWDGWWTEHRRLRSLVQQGAEALRARAGRPARRTESPQTVLLNREIEIPAARFRHLGQHILRWRNQAMAKLRDKGWIERVMVDEDQEGGEMGWVWRGREGEAAEKERKHQRYMLRKGLKQTAVELPRLEEEQMDEDAEVGPRGEHT